MESNVIPTPKHALAVSILPTLFVSLLYYVLLGYRRDYLGHFAAGYGGTICAIAIVLADIPRGAFERKALGAIGLCTVLCIALGTATEATIFRIAKFDEVDYCNQNLGAVLAGLAALQIARNIKPSEMLLKYMIAIGVFFLVIGVYFAFT